MNNWEFQYNSLTLGGTTSFPLNSLTGLSPPDSRVDEVVRMDAHGSFIYAEFLEARRITMQGEILDDPTTNFESLVTLWRAAFAPQPAPLPLSYQLPGGEAKRIYCVPTRRDLPIDFDYNIGRGTFLVELLAEDPRIYSDTPSSSSTQVFVAEGVDFSVDFSFSFGGGTGGVVQCTNNGSYFSPPVIRFTGPCTNPKVRNLSTNEHIRLETVIASGHYLEVDVKERTVVADDGGSRYAYLDMSSIWWELGPGTSAIEFTAEAASGALMNISWRGAWI